MKKYSELALEDLIWFASIVKAKTCPTVLLMDLIAYIALKYTVCGMYV